MRRRATVSAAGLPLAMSFPALADPLSGAALYADVQRTTASGRIAMARRAPNARWPGSRKSWTAPG